MHRSTSGASDAYRCARGEATCVSHGPCTRWPFAAFGAGEPWAVSAASQLGASCRVKVLAG